MNYTEEVVERVGKINEDIAAAWMDYRMSEGKGYVGIGTDAELKAQRAELLDDIVDSINDIEAIDEELKLRADAAAKQKADAEKQVRERLDKAARDLLANHPWSSWTSVGWLDEARVFSTKMPTRTASPYPLYASSL